MRFKPFSSVMISICFMIALAGFATAQETRLAGVDEERARGLFRLLRCVVCQNQSIDDSNADVAKDLRALVREQIQTGKTNEQVLDFLVARYGEFVLLKPKFALHTILLWLTPVLLIVLGLFAILIVIRRKKAHPEPLSVAEQKKFSEIMSRDSDSS